MKMNNIGILIKRAGSIIFHDPKKIFSKRYYHVFFARLFSRTTNSAYYDPMIPFEYQMWLKKNDQKRNKETFLYTPKISIITPVYNVDTEYLDKCINSVIQQTYDNWELCLVDDFSSNKETIEYLKKYKNFDSRIKIKFRKKNGNISEASNDGIKMSTGNFIALLDNDDELDSNALFEVVKVLNQYPDMDFIYTDEDKISKDGKRFDPFFKPDWSPDTLLSLNYICHFCVIRKSMIEDVGCFRKEYDGSQDYDLFLRLTEQTNNIFHISKILYHWRALESSTATGINKKEFASDNGKKALVDALKRRKIDANVFDIKNCNCYHIKYHISQADKISIIVPTKGYNLLLKNCISSIIEKTSYKNYEIIIVNNNTSEKEYEHIRNLYKSYTQISVINLNCEFNYSYINNEAVKIAKGKYIVLLNNDTEIISEFWLDEMLGYASQSHVGIVGVKLLYADNTVQHGGVIIGLGGIAGHAFIGSKKEDSGPFSWLKITRNVGANTAACLMVSKDKYLEVNGLDENLKVAFNDVDFNLKVLEKGYFNIFLSNVELYHYESKTRGLEDTKEKQIRFNDEVYYMQKKWNIKLKRDPYYNDNYSMKYNYKIDIE